MPRFARILAIAAAIAALAGCSTAPKLPVPKSVSTIILLPKERDALATLQVGRALKVVLPPPDGGKGYEWEVVANNTRMTQQIQVLKADPSGSATAVFYALHGGRALIRFAAVKPGQIESEPTDLYQIIIGIKAE